MSDGLIGEVGHWQVAGIVGKAGNCAVGPEEAGGHYNGTFNLLVGCVFVVDGAEKAFVAGAGVAGMGFPIWKNVVEKFVFN